MLKIWISCQKCKTLQKGVVGPIFELHPSNLVRIHIFFSCKNAENFVTKSQVVLEKISVGVLRPYLEASLIYPYWKHRILQGRLKVWTEHSTLILLIFIPFEVAQQKFQHFYN